MGFYRGPQIVTSGLVMYLDAANPKSYSGVGTNWYDRSGGTSSGTLVNAPTFSTNYKGGITFDGTNQYVNCGNTISTQFTHTTTWSFSFFGKVLSQNTTYPGFILKGNPTAAGILVFYANLSGTTYIILKHNNDQPTIVPITIGIPFHYTVAYNGSGTTRVYKNGVYTVNGPTIVSTETTSNLFLGTGEAYGNVTMYNFMKYNIMLSDTQVLQNFNALKSKFNL